MAWKVTSWLLKLSIDSLHPEKSGDIFCNIPMVRSCHSYLWSVNTLPDINRLSMVDANWRHLCGSD